MRVGTIYLIECSLTGMKYVGQTVKPLATRFRAHVTNKSCTYLNRAIRKHGVEFFSIKPLVEEVPEDLLDDFERFVIEIASDDDGDVITQFLADSLDPVG